MNVLLVGVLGALVTGVFIGSQSALGSRIGSLIGPIPTGLLMNTFGGAIAAVLYLILRAVQRGDAVPIPARALVMLVVAGALGILIITGVAFSLPRTGVTAGLAALILGQLLVAVIVDTTGWGGVEPIPLSLQRIAGLGVMALAVYLLLPRQS